MPIQSRERAMTKIELVIVIAIIALLAAVLLPMGARATPRAKRTQCLNNLKQIGLGYRIWSNDCGDKFPWAVPAKDHGTLEFAETSQVYRHFQTASNEFSETKVLICPDDRTRTKAKDWMSLSNSNLSYLVGLDADEGRPDTILSGDRTISTNGNLMSGYVEMLTTGPVMWAKAIHSGVGNISLSDGSAQQITSGGLQLQLQRPGLVVGRFALP